MAELHELENLECADPFQKLGYHHVVIAKLLEGIGAFQVLELVQLSHRKQGLIHRYAKLNNPRGGQNGWKLKTAAQDARRF